MILIVGLGLSSFCLLEVSSQRRSAPSPKRKIAQRGGKVYNNFVHNIAGHRESCSSCHKSPTGFFSAETLTGESYKYPDITDYPDHDSCINCHRQQFFRGAKPAICSICHTKVSPRDKARFAFPRANQSQEFSIRFPHNVHQDIIAGLENPPSRGSGIEAAHFVNAKFIPPENNYIHVKLVLKLTIWLLFDEFRHDFDTFNSVDDLVMVSNFIHTASKKK